MLNIEICTESETSIDKHAKKFRSQAWQGLWIYHLPGWVQKDGE